MKKISYLPTRTITAALESYYTILSPTYGPAGKTVLIDDGMQIKAVDDGKMASEAIELEDENQQSVIKYVQQAAEETDKRVGDGTTTAAVLTVEIAKQLLTDSSVDFQKGTIGKQLDTTEEILKLEKAVGEAVAKIKTDSKDVKTKKELFEVAKNSYKDEDVAKLISEGLFKVGKDGFISVEDSQTTETELEFVNGFRVEKGFATPYLINTTQGTTEIKDAAVILIGQKLDADDNYKALLTLLEKSGKKNVVIVADGFDDAVIRSMILFKMNSALNPLLLETPGYGAQKEQNLQDIAAVVGATIINPQAGSTFEDVTNEWFGGAEIVRSDKDETSFVNGGGKGVDKRVNELEREADRATSEMEKDRYARRIAQLNGGMAVIRVGAVTEHEQTTKRAKVEDSVNATKAAYQGGLSKGAGKTFESITTSSEILNEALKAPRKLLEDNGKQFLDNNVLDPTEVLVSALETAVSTAVGLVGMGSIISPKREDDDK